MLGKRLVWKTGWPEAMCNRRLILDSDWWIFRAIYGVRTEVPSYYVVSLP